MEAYVDDKILLDKVENIAGLTNEDILSDLERRRGRCLLDEVQYELIDLAQKIQRASQLAQHSFALELELDALLTTHWHMSKRFETLEVALAPHKRLPPEILGEIFAYCSGNEPATFPGEFELETRSRWVLGRVCRHWRNVMWSEPRLWKSLLIDFPAVRCQQAPLIAFKRLLASQVASSVTVKCYDNSDITALDHLSLFLDAMTPENLASIRSLHLSITTSLAQKDVFSKYTPGNAFTMAGRLTKLQIDCLGGELLKPILRLGIPFNQLTDLVLMNGELVPFIEVHQILGECTDLERFSVSIKPSSGACISGGRQMPKLQCLKVNIRDGQIFQHLHVPALTALHISGNIPFPHIELSKMVVRSKCQLLSLEYDGEWKPMTYDIKTLHDFFEIIPFLKSLSTFFLVLREDTLRRIALGELLPRLEVVQIRIDSPPAFVALLERRLEGVVKDSKLGIIREARGFYVRLVHGHARGMAAASERLQKFNEEYGTNFTIQED